MDYAYPWTVTVYYCHGYLVRKIDGGIIDAVIEWRKRFEVQIGIDRAESEGYFLSEGQEGGTEKN